MGGETDASEGATRETTPRARGRLATAWWVLRIVLGVGAVVLALALHFDPELRERKAMKRGNLEPLQTLQSGRDTYTLHYFRGYRANIVTKNGTRVFDSRDTDTQGCIRLVRRESGRVELECQHKNRSEAVFFTMP